ncbi:hypothetical protein [Patiriisocius sp. Uisw_017]|jgi:hypothetical protein|uniref:hypothetical protein n=1 Tax=Patiriisocius sp. Uisw_017 TaxID=3230968 RepID=UPI0039E8967B
MKYLIIFTASLLICSCNNKKVSEERQYSIDRTNRYVESLEYEVDSLKTELEKCADWVDLLEEKNSKE